MPLPLAPLPLALLLAACLDPEPRRAGPVDQPDTDTGTLGPQTGDGGGTGDGGATGDGGGDGGGDGPAALVGGFRASPYGAHAMSDAAYWTEVAQGMADRFDGAAPGGVWIVGVAGDDGTCYLNFPSPGGSWDDIGFSSQDANEDALHAFDAAGLQIWIQVEPGDASVEDLVTLVMDRYGHHESVVGFGVDVEWFRFRNYADGKPVTDDKAADWRDALRAYDADHTLFLKHWLPEKMPPTEREGLLFVDDGQDVGSLSALVATFDDWGRAFAPAPVGFQYGYETDRGWWSDLDDPPGDIGRALLEEVPNTAALFWVDFTVEEVFPP